MFEFLSTLLKGVKRPLLLLLAVLGAVLILLGVTGGAVKIQGTSLPLLANGFRITAIGLGLAFLAVAVLREFL